MDDALILSGSSRGKNTAKNTAKDALNRVGSFVQGDNGMNGNKVDKYSNILLFSVINPTTIPQTIDLFGFSATAFSAVPVNPPPSILNGVLPATGAGPIHSAFCSVNNFIYSVDLAGNTVTVVDCANNVVFATIPMVAGFFPNAIAYNSLTNQMYVGSSALPQVIRIDCATNAVVGAPIATLGGSLNSALAYNSIKNTMYGIFTAATFVLEISCVTNLVIATFLPPGAVAVTALAFNPNLGTGGRIYISDVAINNVYVVDCATNLTLVTIPTGLAATGALAFCSSNSSIYVAGFASNNVLQINTITNVPGALIPGIVAGPSAIAYNIINNLLYVSAATTNNFYIINPVSNVVLSVNPLGGVTPTGVVFNGTRNSLWFTFNTSSNVQEFAPTIPPSAVVILNGNQDLSVLLRDIQGKPLLLVGLKMIVDTFAQFFNNISIDYLTINGKRNIKQFQPSNYLSPTSNNQFVIDATDFKAEVDGNTNITFSVEPLSEMLLSLTITAAVDNTVPLFKDIVDNWGAGTEETTVLFRNTNPIQDIIEQEKVNRILSDPGHNSFAQYADYPVEYADSPRLTGNAFADIALLNSAGLQDNHS